MCLAIRWRGRSPASASPAEAGASKVKRERKMIAAGGGHGGSMTKSAVFSSEKIAFERSGVSRPAAVRKRVAPEPRTLAPKTPVRGEHAADRGAGRLTPLR